MDNKEPMLQDMSVMTSSVQDTSDSLPLSLRRPKREAKAPIYYSPDVDSDISEGEEDDEDSNGGGEGDEDYDPRDGHKGIDGVMAIDEDEAASEEEHDRLLNRGNYAQRLKKNQGHVDVSSSDDDDGAEDDPLDKDYVPEEEVDPFKQPSESSSSASSDDEGDVTGDSDISGVLSDADFDVRSDESASDFDSDNDVGEIRRVKLKDLLTKPKKAADPSNKEEGKHKKDKKERKKTHKGEKKSTTKGEKKDTHKGHNNARKRHRVDSTASTNKPLSKARKQLPNSNVPRPVELMTSAMPTTFHPPPHAPTHAPTHPPPHPPTHPPPPPIAPTPIMQPSQPLTQQTSMSYGMDLFGFGGGYRP